MTARRQFVDETGNAWQIQEAKNRLSKVVRLAQSAGPQTITLHGKPMAVVVSYEMFRAMTRPAVPLSRFIMESPLAGVDLDFTRAEDPGREVDL